MLIVRCHMPDESYTLTRAISCKGFGLGGIYGWKVVVPESCVEIRHAILAKFHKPFFRTLLLLQRVWALRHLRLEVFL